MVKRVVLNELGSPNVLKIEEYTIPQPKQDEMHVKILSIGLNRAESNIRQGKYLQQPELPSNLGFEASGIVLALGNNESNFNIGDYVSFIPDVVKSEYGVYAAEAIMPIKLAVKTPENINPEIASAMWMQYLTAYGGLVEAGKLATGDYVLITAASSSVGLAAINITKKLGGISIVTSRDPNKREMLQAAGADYVIITSEEDLIEKVALYTNSHGIDLVFDPIAGDYVNELGKVSAFNGRIIIYGGMQGPYAVYPFVEGVHKGLTMRAFYLLELTYKKDWRDRAINFILNGIQDQSLKVVIDKSFDLIDIVSAHEYLDSNQQFGKIIVKP